MNITIIDYLKRKMKIQNRKLSISERALKYLAYFFVLMIILTCISNAADSITVPIVNVGNISSKNLNFSINGTGTIESGKEEYLSIYENLRVIKVYLKSGSSIKAGEPVFAYDNNDINKMYNDKKTELAKLEIGLNKIILEGSKENEKIDTYNEEVGNLKAELNLNEAKKDLEQAKIDYDESYDKIVRKYEKQNKDDIDQKKTEYDKAVLNLKEIKISNEKALNESKRNIEDAENKLDAIEKYIEEADKDDEEEPKYNKEDKKNAKNNIDRAEEDYELIKKQCDISLNKAKNEVKVAKENLDNAGTEKIDEKVDLKDEQTNIDNSEKNIKTSVESLEDARNNLEKAYKKKEIDEKNREIEKSIDNLDIESARLDLQKAKREISILDELVRSNGQVISKYDGTVSKMELEEGKFTTGQEAVSINVGNYIFKAEINKDEVKHIKVGDKILVNANSMAEPANLKVSSISLPDSNGMCCVNAIFNNDFSLRIGEEAQFSIGSTSAQYDQCISIDALRADNKGKFVLIAKESNTTLGKEITATRINIDVLDNSSNEMALNGPLNRNDKVILSSNKNIEEGDRVRVEENTDSDNEK